MSGLGCVSVPPKFWCPLPQALYSDSVPGTVLFYLQCTIYTVVCDQIGNKSSSFVVLNVSILRKYRGKPSLRSASFLAIYRTLIIAFLLKSYCSKSALLKSGASPASRDRGGKIKIRGKGFRRFPKAFSGRNYKFSDQKQMISKKKKSSPKSEGFFWPKSQIIRLKAGDLQKKGPRRNPKAFSGRNHKF